MLVARAISAFTRRLPLCAAIAALPLLSSSGCFSLSDGIEPPLLELYFPTNLVVSPARSVLYVTNSDFDLQYNGGTVQALDLGALRGTVSTLADTLHGGVGTDACASVGLGPNQENILYPGPCSPLTLGPFVKASRIIGAFASSAVFVRPTDPATQTARLFVSVRGDPSVTYFDVADDAAAGVTDPFRLDCGQTSSSSACSSAFRVGINAGDNTRGLTLPVEPMGIAASPAGDAIVTVHQTTQAASLVFNDGKSAPTLEFTALSLPFGPIDLTALPEPGAVRASKGSIAWQPGYVVSFRGTAELDLIRYNDDVGSSPRRRFLTRAGATAVAINQRGFDQRGIAVDSSERQACEASCDKSSADDAALSTCMRACLSIPLRLFAASRAPTALLVGDVQTFLVERDGQATSVFDQVSVRDTFPLAFGASRVAVGQVIGEDGQLHTRVFALAFDSRLAFIFDPVARRVESIIHTGRGPQSIAFDTGGEGADLRSYLYIGHFTDSYIGVVDLDMRRPATFGSMFLTVGVPRPPRGTK